jgi:hypothetical protein
MPVKLKREISLWESLRLVGRPDECLYLSVHSFTIHPLFVPYAYVCQIPPVICTSITNRYTPQRYRYRQNGIFYISKPVN